MPGKKARDRRKGMRYAGKDMADIQFYHLTSTPLERALPKLLEKAYAGGFHTLVLAGSEENAEQLAAQLWTYDPDSFLPHGSVKDGFEAEQPIFISAHRSNPNNAGLLVITDGSMPQLNENCKRVLDIFDGHDAAAVARARQRWKHYESAGHSVTYIRQNHAGGWEKQAA